MKSYGGFLFFDSVNNGKDDIPDGVRLNSSGACLYHLLNNIKKKKIFIPFYICNSVINVLEALNYEFCFYSINEDFSIKNMSSMQGDNYILYVNYFGLNDCNCERILNFFGNDKVILDCSQAFFSSRLSSLATIYSPRKFLALPDGGILSSEAKLEEPEQIDETSYLRLSHLFGAKYLGQNAVYQKYLEAERSIERTQVKRMSFVTQALMESYDIQMIKDIRSFNYHFYVEYLHSLNMLNLPSTKTPALCYPLLLNDKDVGKIKVHLAEKNIYIPVYWKEVLDRVLPGSFEFLLASQVLFLPLDHRINSNDIKILAGLIQSL